MTFYAEAHVVVACPNWPHKTPRFRSFDCKGLIQMFLSSITPSTELADMTGDHWSLVSTSGGRGHGGITHMTSPGFKMCCCNCYCWTLRVFPQQSVSGNLEELHLSEAWFHGKLNRATAEGLLKGHLELGDGAFLVRESDTFIGDFSLSFLWVTFLTCRPILCFDFLKVVILTVQDATKMLLNETWKINEEFCERAKQLDVAHFT